MIKINKQLALIILFIIISVVVSGCAEENVTASVSSSSVSVSTDYNSLTTEKDTSKYYEYIDNAGKTIKLNITAVREKGGWCLDATEYCDGYALIYENNVQAGIVLYDKNAEFVELREFCHTGAKLEPQNIFRYSNIEAVECMGENGNFIAMYDYHPDGTQHLHFLYDVKNYTMHRCDQNNKLTKENGDIYHLNVFSPNYMQGDNIYMLSQHKEDCVEYFTFTYPVIDTLSVFLKDSDKDNSVTLDIPRVGMEITVDFAEKSMSKYTDISKREGAYPDDTPYNTVVYNLYDTSPSGRYNIYVIDSNIAGTFNLDKLALVDNYTGKSKYLCELEGNGFSDIPAYAGFLSDDEIYHVNDDYIIYSTDIENDSILFRLSDIFPFNNYVDEKGNTIVKRVFEFRETEDQRFVAVYCQYPYGDSTPEDNTYFISIFDNRGNHLKTFDTGINLEVDCGVYWSYIDGDNLEMYCEKTDAAIIGTFNLADGSFTPSEKEE